MEALQMHILSESSYRFGYRNDVHVKSLLLPYTVYLKTFLFALFSKHHQRKHGICAVAQSNQFEKHKIVKLYVIPQLIKAMFYVSE
jgi:hypothetical protein